MKPTQSTVHPSEGAFQPLRLKTGTRSPENPVVINSFSYFSRPSSGQRGFTLIELMVAVAVFAVLLGIAVPSFQSLSASNQVTSQTNDFVSALNLARSEAIRRGSRVTVCKSSDGASCVTANHWEQGWIVFVDTTRSGTDAAVDVGETVLAVQQGAGGNVVLRGSADVVNFVSFAPDGRPKLMLGAAQSGVILSCSTSGALGNDRRARSINISATGRLSTTTPSGIASTCPTPTT